MNKKIKRVLPDPVINQLRKTKITAHEWLVRHSHCITVREIRQNLERSLSDHVSYGLGVPHFIKGSDHIPADILAVCDFPNDGICGKEPPSEEQLVEINARLSGKTSKVPEVVDFNVLAKSDPEFMHDLNGDRVIPKKMKLTFGGK